MPSSTRAHPDSPADSAACYNCEQPLARGDGFCSKCGQKRQSLQVTLVHLVSLWWAATFDIDNKFWRTLWALFRHPGKLTQEFMLGRRVRYLRPVTLCLLSTGAFFLSLQWATSSVTPIRELQVGSDGVVQIDVLPGFRVALPEAYFDASDAPMEDRMAIIEEFVGQELSPSQRYWLPRILTYVSDEGISRLQGRLIEIGSRVAFALIPMFAFVVFLLHYRRATFVESVIYGLHVHSCAFLMAAMGCILPQLVRPFFAPVLTIALVGYVCQSLRVAFGNPILSAIWKTLALLFAELFFTFLAVSGVVYSILIIFDK